MTPLSGYRACGSLLDTESDAVDAVVGDYLTAGGLNDVSEVGGMLADCTDAELLVELLTDGWIAAEPKSHAAWLGRVDKAAWLDGIARFRESRPDRAS